MQAWCSKVAVPGLVTRIPSNASPRLHVGLGPVLSLRLAGPLPGPGPARYGTPADDPQHSLELGWHLVQHHPPAPWPVPVVALAVGPGQQDDRAKPRKIAVIHPGQADMDVFVPVRDFLQRSDQARIGGFVDLSGQGQDGRTARPGDAQYAIVIYRILADHCEQPPPW